MGSHGTGTVMNPHRLADVLLWAIFLPKGPDVGQIRRRWGVSRATAYRWQTFLAESRQKAAVIAAGMMVEVVPV